MKKFTLNILICISLAIGMLSITSFAAEEKTVISDEAVNVIKLLEIANGDQNGNMNYGNDVTRAEFVKMTVNASPDKALASNTKLNISLFPDVRNHHWAASYISVAIDKGLVNGYLDGTFKPSNPVTLEEAATIVLRLLGYTNSDLVGNYPTAQLNKYRELELDENISANQGEKMTREQCMILLYNMLSTKTKNGNVYCTTLGYSVDADNTLDYSALLKSKLDGPYIADSNAGFADESGFIENDNTLYKLNNADSTKESIKANDIIYTNDVINTVFVYRKTATGIVSASNEAAVTVGAKTYMISTAKAKQKLALGGKFSHEKAFVTLLLGIDDTVVDVIEGDIDALSSNNDNATYLEMIDATISSPIFINTNDKLLTWNSEIPFDITDAKIYFNGKETDNYVIDKNDVIYYSEPFKSIWIFRDTQSGIINAITSNTVTLSSGTYILATNDAKFKVSTYGEYDTKDYVTLILGKNSEVIDIIDASTSGIGSSDNDSSYSEVVSSTLKGPYVVSAAGTMDNLGISAQDALIYRDSKLTDPSDIKPYDVYYYSEVLNTIWIYRKTASGTIEAVSPAASPVSVVLSGTSYVIESSAVSYELSSFGSYDIGDKATLLLGMDDKVAGIVSPEIISEVVYGVITAKGEKQYTDKNGNAYTSNFVTVTDTTGASHSYQYSRNSFTVGDVVRVTVSGTTQITRMTTDIGKSEAAKISSAIKNGNFSKNCNIIDISGSDIEKVYPERLIGCEIDPEQFTFSTVVLYCLFEDGLITDMILNDFTGDIDSYGVVTSSKSGNITYLSDSSIEKNISASSGCSIGPARLIIENGSVIAASSLTGVIDNVDYITANTVVDDNGTSYSMSDDFTVYKKNNDTSYEYVELEDVNNGEYSFKAYYDKLPKYGGRIRVIIATRKV